MPVLNVAPIGMGGFASDHHAALRTLENEGLCRVVAACDPDRRLFAEFRHTFDLDSRDIPVHDDYFAMLEAHAGDLDFVTVPTPIAWHQPMHRACVDLGIPCYLEKPPTLHWRELDAMLEAEAQARRQTMVGFAHIVEEPRRRLKQRILAGEFGRRQSAGFMVSSARNTAYYERVPWAGRLLLDGRVILDSCIGNALSHFIHNVLFWCGDGEVLSWQPLAEIEAEFYRAHDIESLDTCFARGHCNNGIEVRIAATHSGAGPDMIREWVQCENALITYESGVRVQYSIEWRDGRVTRVSHEQVDLLLENIRSYIDYINGDADRPLTRLIDSQPFVHCNGLLYIAAERIHNIPEEYLTRRNGLPDEGQWILIDGLQPAMQEFCESGRLPGEGAAPWGRAGGYAAAAQITRLESTVQSMYMQRRSRSSVLT